MHPNIYYGAPVFSLISPIVPTSADGERLFSDETLQGHSVVNSEERKVEISPKRCEKDSQSSKFLNVKVNTENTVNAKLDSAKLDSAELESTLLPNVTREASYMHPMNKEETRMFNQKIPLQVAQKFKENQESSAGRLQNSPKTELECSQETKNCRDQCEGIIHRQVPKNKEVSQVQACHLQGQPLYGLPYVMPYGVVPQPSCILMPKVRDDITSKIQISSKSNVNIEDTEILEAAHPLQLLTENQNYETKPETGALNILNISGDPEHDMENLQNSAVKELNNNSPIREHDSKSHSQNSTCQEHSLRNHLQNSPRQEQNDTKLQNSPNQIGVGLEHFPKNTSAQISQSHIQSAYHIYGQPIYQMPYASSPQLSYMLMPNRQIVPCYTGIPSFNAMLTSVQGPTLHQALQQNKEKEIKREQTEQSDSIK